MTFPCCCCPFTPSLSRYDDPCSKCSHLHHPAPQHHLCNISISGHCTTRATHPACLRGRTTNPTSITVCVLALVYSTDLAYVRGTCRSKSSPLSSGCVLFLCTHNHPFHLRPQSHFYPLHPPTPHPSSSYTTSSYVHHMLPTRASHALLLHALGSLVRAPRRLTSSPLLSLPKHHLSPPSPVTSSTSPCPQQSLHLFLSLPPRCISPHTRISPVPHSALTQFL